MWLAFTTNPHLLDHFGHRWTDEKREGSADVGLATNAVRVRATRIQQQLLWTPQLKVPGSGISKLGCTSGCYQTLRFTAPGLQSGQVHSLWETATARSLLTTG